VRIGQFHVFDDLNLLMNLEWFAEVERVLRSIICHFARDICSSLGVDDEEGEGDLLCDSRRRG